MYVYSLFLASTDSFLIFYNSSFLDAGLKTLALWPELPVIGLNQLLSARNLPPLTWITKQNLSAAFVPFGAFLMQFPDK